MGLLVECPECKKRCSPKADKCSCGFGLKKAGGKSYWIEYYDGAQRHRERIGPSKDSAEQRLREVLTARTEGRHIKRDQAVRTSLGDLCKWYLELPEVKAKASYRRDREFIEHLKRILGEDIKIRDLNPGRVESYQVQRRSEPSVRHKGENVRPATINKEVTCLKTILNRAVRHGRLETNPIEKVRKLPENNVRMRVLTGEEYDKLIEACPVHLCPVVEMAYFMPMRRSEIVFLTWPEVDLKTGFIRLPAHRTKTGAARAVPIHPVVRRTLESLPRAIHTDRVFLRDGQPFHEIKRSYTTALKKAGIENFTFHDLRHCSVNNLRLAGNDYFTIMAASGHKTVSTFKRYNLVTEEDLVRIKWKDIDGETGAIDTNMDTKTKRATAKTP